MSSTELTSTLDFLTDAGHLLATTAPEVSAFLMSRRNNILFENELPQSQRQHVCTCCGHIMIMGQGSSLKVEHRKAMQRNPRLSKGKEHQSDTSPRSGPAKMITCGHCGRLTKTKLPAPAPISRRKIKAQEPINSAIPKQQLPGMAQTPQEAPSQKANSNANSKKRAKSRKAGLQALLDQNNATQGTRPGLSLSLFMKK
ncbi:hypothetical protein B0H66DRAFT_333153 [Apodospora peruviana]|uniref:Uncharacterized protein n=1 Tax=Apodospora peruviana TaxID=516989 RepID=A0AAE0HY64_9PEZI|nr:hypothetical protein B0H66DRAFT_333153 [Apodospora peruviana]